MIEDLSGTGTDVELSADLAVVGAGPAGIVVALEAARRGVKVLLIESGKETFEPSLQSLSDAAEWDRHRHAPVSLAVRRQVGGTSTIWGGRCVPYDPVDFATRAVAGSAPWPVSYDEMRSYFSRACDWLVCGRAVFDASETAHLPPSIVPGLTAGDITSSTLERWSLPTNFGTVYREQLSAAASLRVVTGVTCTRIVCPAESRRADILECRTLAGRTVRVRAKSFVVACGGLEGTRLLMASTAPQGGQLGNGSGQLGRWYMAHVEGCVANVRFSTPPRSTIFGYERDIDGVYVRRRIAFSEDYQLRHELPNVVAWLGNPELPDASHQSGPLSFVYLALTSPLGPRFAPEAQRLALTGADIPGTPYGGATISPRRAHVRNILSEPVTTARFTVGFGARRFLVRGRRAPGFFVFNKDNVYPFQYHGEHIPNPESRVTLSRDRDELGRPKLDVDIRFAKSEIEGIMRAHRKWDEHLRSAGVGQLEYQHDDLPAAIEQRMGGGFHQIGTTRMAADAKGGVVDGDLAVHGVENVHVASSSTFVTSGQANSTFMIVAFAVRLADHLCSLMR